MFLEFHQKSLRSGFCLGGILTLLINCTRNDLLIKPALLGTPSSLLKLHVFFFLLYSCIFLGAPMGICILRGLVSHALLLLVVLEKKIRELSLSFQVIEFII